MERLTKWFEDLQSVIIKHGIKLGNLYNMDESGVAISDIEASQHIINTTIRQRFQAKPGRQEWVTAIECICADGSSIPPLIIFKGVNLSRQWVPTNIHNNWRVGCNTKGWTSNIHGLQWLRQVFEPTTRDKVNSKLCLLICNAHDSHITASWIAHCMTNNIIVMVLTPHSSHLTQSLDVRVFSPLKTLMASAIEPLVSTELHRILKAEWLAAYVDAQCVVRRSEHMNARNVIIEEGYEKLKAAVTKRKAILSGKRKIVDGKHILTMTEIHDDLVVDAKKPKKRKTTGTQKNKGGASETEQEFIDEFEAIQDIL
jgi:hypothetical protein